MTATGDELTADQVEKWLDRELGSSLSWADSILLDPVHGDLDSRLGAVPYWDAADYANMLRSDGQARKVEQILTLPLLSVPYKIEPGPNDKGEAKLVEQLLTRPAAMGGMSTPLRVVLAQMTSAVTYRVASFEKVYARFQLDGKTRIGYRSLSFRPATSTRVLRDRRTGGYMGLEQDPIDSRINAGEPIRIRAERSFTYVHGIHREPILGTSDMEVALTAWRVKQKIRFLWFLFLESKALPKVTTKSTGEGAGGDDATRNAAKKIAALSGGGVAGLPAGVDASVLESGGRAFEYYRDAMDYLDSEMTGSVLAQFADLASSANSGTGSYALSKDQSDLFLQSRHAIHREMEDAFTEYVIADLVRLNMGPDASVPRLVFAPIDGPTLEALLTNLPNLAGKPGIPGELIAFLVAAVANLLHVPEDKVAAMTEQAAKTSDEAAEKATQPPPAPLAAQPAPAALKPGQMPGQKPGLKVVTDARNTNRRAAADGGQRSARTGSQ